MANEIPSYIMKIGNHELNYSEKLMNVVLNLSEGKNTFMYCMTIGVVRKKSAKWEKIETKKYGFILHSPNSKKSNSVSYGRTYLLPSILISVRLDEKQFKFLISNRTFTFDNISEVREFLLQKINESRLDAFIDVISELIRNIDIIEAKMAILKESHAKTNDRPKRKHRKKIINELEYELEELEELKESEELEKSEKSKNEREESEKPEDELEKPEDELEKQKDNPDKEKNKLIKHKLIEEKQFNEYFDEPDEPDEGQDEPDEEPKKHIRINPQIFTNTTCDETISQPQSQPSQPISQQQISTFQPYSSDDYVPPFITQQQTQMLQIQQQQFQMLQQQQQLLQQLQMAAQQPTPHQMAAQQPTPHQMAAQQPTPHQMAPQPPEAIPLMPRMTQMQQYIRDQMLPHPALFYNQGIPTYDKKNTKVVCFTIDENGDIRSVREFHHQE